MQTLFQGLGTIQSRLEDLHPLLPSPLAERLSPFWEKLKTDRIILKNASRRSHTHGLSDAIDPHSSTLRCSRVVRNSLSTTNGPESFRSTLDCRYIVTNPHRIRLRNSHKQWMGMDSHGRDRAGDDWSTNAFKNRTMPRFLQLPLPQLFENTNP